MPLALAGGIVAGLNPCCVALYPAAAAACGRVRGNEPRHGLVNSIAFALGLATATALLGIIAAMIGRIAAVDRPLRYVVAFVPLLMAFHLLGWIKLPLPDLSNKGSSVGTFSAGFMFSLIIGPCSTPVLASVLSYAAVKGNLIYGAALLFVYGMGVSVPLFCTAAFSARLTQKLDRSGYGVWVNRGMAASLFGVGFYLLWVA